METIILDRLASMAKRLGITSNQAILIYAGNEGWLNLERTATAISILQKIAGNNKIDFLEDEPFLVQLVRKGVILPEEAVIFGFKVKRREEENGNGKTEGDQQAVDGYDASDNGRNLKSGINGADRTGPAERPAEHDND